MINNKVQNDNSNDSEYLIVNSNKKYRYYYYASGRLTCQTILHLIFRAEYILNVVNLVSTRCI